MQQVPRRVAVDDPLAIARGGNAYNVVVVVVVVFVIIERVRNIV